MAIITTHRGGPYYNWRVSVLGSPPPGTFNEDGTPEGVLYHDWQHGVPRAQAATDYLLATIGSAGSTLAPPPAPPGAPPPPIQAIEAPQPPQPPPAPPQPPPGAGAEQPIAGIAQDRPLPTEYGVTLNSEQIAIVRDVFNIGLTLGMSRLVLEAAYYAMMGESNIHILAGIGGVFQTTCNLSAYNDGTDYKAQAHSFFRGGECFARGAASYATVYRTAWQIANAVEENLVWSQSRGDSYARSGFSTAQLTSEAEYAVSYFLPGLGTTVAPPGGTPQASAPSEGGVFDTFKALNWAGDFENLWKYVQGGANEAAHMADQFEADRINHIDIVGW